MKNGINLVPKEDGNWITSALLWALCCHSYLCWVVAPSELSTEKINVISDWLKNLHSKIICCLLKCIYECWHLLYKFSNLYHNSQLSFPLTGEEKQNSLVNHSWSLKLTFLLQNLWWFRYSYLTIVTKAHNLNMVTHFFFAFHVILTVPTQPLFLKLP